MTDPASLLARIAALHPSDRQWLLSQASPETRARITGALEAAQALENGAAVGHRGALSPRDVIASATPEHVARALQAQPAWLVSVLLRMDEWPWSAALFKRVPVLQRATAGLSGSRSGQPALRLKPALAAAILKSFARSLTLIEAPAVAPSQRLPPFESLLQRFRISRNEQELGF